VAVNVGLTLLYWKVGDRIRREVLGFERAGYGEQIVATLSQLVTEWGCGYSDESLHRMVQFAETFPDDEARPRSGTSSTVATVSRQSVSEYLTVVPAREVLERKLQESIETARLRFESRDVGEDSR
jgi:hypothetical protein